MNVKLFILNIILKIVDDVKIHISIN